MGYYFLDYSSYVKKVNYKKTSKTDKKSWTSGMRQKKRMIGTPTLNFLPQKSQVCPNSGL